jgi:hypothetical protein
VIEGFPLVRELVATGANTLQLNDVLFRSEKLVDRTPMRDPTPPVTVSLAIATMGAIATVGGLPPVAAPSSTNGTITPATSTTSTPAPASATTYARAIGNASPPPQITLPMQPKPAATPVRPVQEKPPPWNPGRRGVDPPIQVSQAALDSIKKRKDSNKLCNNHYLRGPCSKGESCCFEHKYKPTKDEINAIAFLTRLNPCANGQECDVEDCIYGHHVSDDVWCLAP